MNTEISTEESQASLGTIEADQNKTNESLDVAVPQPDGTTEIMPTPPEPNPEKRPDKNPIDNVEEIQGDPVSGLVTDDPATQKVEVTLDVALKDVVIPGKEINGAGNTTGSSYYNFLAYYSDVKQVLQLMDDPTNQNAVFKDATGNVITKENVNDMLALLDKINSFDVNAGIKYDWDSVYNSEKFEKEDLRGGLDVVAGDEKASLKFHIDSHGWWGYELVGDTIIQAVMPDSVTNGLSNKEVANKYSNFFVIDMKKPGDDSNGKWYMLRNTDLENPMLYISADGKEALMIDVDFYGENVLADLLRQLLGLGGNITRELVPGCEKLNILFTHMHGDHVNNLVSLLADPVLKNIIHVYWPDGEPHTMVDGKDVIASVDPDRLTNMKDGFTLEFDGIPFVFNQIIDEHTPAGGQFADLKNKIQYSGDTLGAQIHLGGTTAGAAQLDSWISGAKKTIDFIQKNGLEYIIGAHTPYLNTPEFANWLLEACNYAKTQLAKDPNWSGLVIVENGKVVTPERMAEMMKSGLSDRDELNVLSVNFRNSQAPVQPEEPADPEEKEDENKANEQLKEDTVISTAAKETGKEDSMKTSPDTGIAIQKKGSVLSALMIAAAGLFVSKKHKQK
ncbi:MBL fold metallo-hydrolase [uncultured Dubosiella sp.]|uniref:MBL fold metallo-hydrolase n=2 Tax=uncultured Dubosiella sp. TaxID=1937011 RepID=UPI00261A8E9B|nr:MBL fold metallo-hydrolase [uncultured Dubosiella sp.]